MIDHIDILKDGASAVYGSDAVAGVVNFFLIHKFRGLEIGGVTGTQTWERPTTWASGRHGSKPAREMTRPNCGHCRFLGAYRWLFSATGTCRLTRFNTLGGGDSQRDFPGAFGGLPLDSRACFSARRYSATGVNTPLPHSAPNAATSPFYKNPILLAVNPNAYPGAPVSSARMQPFLSTVRHRI
jgi:outer membrane receptor protein involved in Fe transport